MLTHWLFDLDGTLTNSESGILNSVRYALGKMGRELPSPEQLHSFIGPPLLRSFTEVCGMSHSEALRAIDLYREYYHEHGVFDCTVYDGIPELLDILFQCGATLALATCKPTFYAQKILEHFDLAKYFSLVSGPELDGTRGEKHEVIAYAVERLGCEPSRTVMVGDHRDDMLGARQNGLTGFGALWGFGSEEELRTAGAARIYKTPEELRLNLIK